MLKKMSKNSYLKDNFKVDYPLEKLVNNLLTIKSLLKNGNKINKKYYHILNGAELSLNQYNKDLDTPILILKEIRSYLLLELNSLVKDIEILPNGSFNDKFYNIIISITVKLDKIKKINSEYPNIYSPIIDNYNIVFHIFDNLINSVVRDHTTYLDNILNIILEKVDNFNISKINNYYVIKKLDNFNILYEASNTISRIYIDNKLANKYITDYSRNLSKKILNLLDKNTYIKYYKIAVDNEVKVKEFIDNGDLKGSTNFFNSLGGTFILDTSNKLIKNLLSNITKNYELSYDKLGEILLNVDNVKLKNIKNNLLLIQSVRNDFTKLVDSNLVLKTDNALEIVYNRIIYVIDNNYVKKLDSVDVRSNNYSPKFSKPLESDDIEIIDMIKKEVSVLYGIDTRIDDHINSVIKYIFSIIETSILNKNVSNEIGKISNKFQKFYNTVVTNNEKLDLLNYLFFNSSLNFLKSIHNIKINTDFVEDYRIVSNVKMVEAINDKNRRLIENKLLDIDKRLNSYFDTVSSKINTLEPENIDTLNYEINTYNTMYPELFENNDILNMLKNINELNILNKIYLDIHSEFLEGSLKYYNIIKYPIEKLYNQTYIKNYLQKVVNHYTSVESIGVNIYNEKLINILNSYFNNSFVGNVKIFGLIDFVNEFPPLSIKTETLLKKELESTNINIDRKNRIYNIIISNNKIKNGNI